MFNLLRKIEQVNTEAILWFGTYYWWMLLLHFCLLFYLFINNIFDRISLNQLRLKNETQVSKTSDYLDDFLENDLNTLQ